MLFLILGKAVDGLVGANLFAYNSQCVRINSHLPMQYNAMKR